MREHLSNLQRRKTVRDLVDKARTEFKEQMEQQRRRKDWTVKALKRQGERVDEMFDQLSLKLQAEQQMTEAEVRIATLQTCSFLTARAGEAVSGAFECACVTLQGRCYPRRGGCACVKGGELSRLHRRNGKLEQTWHSICGPPQVQHCIISVWETNVPA
jgi:hypothetical protein